MEIAAGATGIGLKVAGGATSGKVMTISATECNALDRIAVGGGGSGCKSNGAGES